MHAADAARGASAALRRYAPLVALPLGALQSLSFAPFGLWPLGPCCLTLLWWLWQDASPQAAARTGFAFSAGLFLAGTYWLYTSIHGFGQAPVAVALFLMLGLVAIMGAYGAALAWLVTRYAPAQRLALQLAVLPAGWVLLEWFRGWFLSGFPWLAVGYSAIDTPLAGFAPVVGVYGVSLAVTWTAGLLLAALGTRGRRRLLVVATLAALWGAGALLARIDWTRPAGTPVSVALVQGSIPQDLKWQEDNREHTLEVYRSLTEQAWGARLIVWPEAALPMLYHEAVPYLTSVYRAAQDHGADLVLGLLRYDFEASRYRNGLIALGRDEEWYYKRRLVPFGEFFPVPPFVRTWMRLKSLAYVDFLAGAAEQGPLDAAGQKLGATICYEDAYGVEQLGILRQATLLVNVSNDAWFGDSTAPHQHLEITRMRALEAGRWLLRATNNGVSALIDPHGRVTARTRQFVPEVLRGQVVPYTGLTPYAQARNWPVLALLALLLLQGAVFRRAAVPL
jgi:apolipoprotein N-acyltransferase